MAPKDDAATAAWEPNPEVLALWPEISGNAINGLGETQAGPPRPVFWRTDGSTPHAPVMYYFYEKDKDNEAIAAARKYRERTKAIPVHDIAEDRTEHSTAAWVDLVKAAAREMQADDVGIAAWRPEWAFPDRPAPQGQWAVVMAFAQDYAAMETAPSDAAYIEVMAQYERAGNAAKHLSNWIRDRGYFAAPKTGPMTEDVLMIPAAIEAGMGELGKHGSMIHRRFGSDFRLSVVLTDVPLVADAPDVFGADDFCQSCQICTNACPPGAISPEKQMVRGERKWYVDFDKCIPYFVDNKTCGICLAVCPWSRPGVADNLVAKMARKRQAAAG
jgi:epoxyqueuosine reductase